jgi:hypothetical protein
MRSHHRLDFGAEISRPVALSANDAPIGIVTLKHRTLCTIGQRFVESTREVAKQLGPVLSYAIFSRERIRIKRGTPFNSATRCCKRGIQISC